MSKGSTFSLFSSLSFCLIPCESVTDASLMQKETLESVIPLLSRTG